MQSEQTTRPAACEPVKLLIVSSDTWKPFRVDVTVLFGEEIAGRGHQLDWILQSEDACDKAFETQWGGGTVWVGRTDVRDSLLARIRKHTLGILHDLTLFKRVRQGDYDAVEVKDKFISGIWAVLAKKLYKVRFIYWLSYPFPEDYLYRAGEPGTRWPLLYRIRGRVFHILLYRFLLPNADHVFVQSEQMKKDVAAQGIDPACMTAVPMGIRVEPDAPAPAPRVERQLIPAGEKVILYLGTLHKVRRMDFVIRVLARVLEQEPGAKLYLIGKGVDDSDEQVLIDEAARLGVSDSLVMVGQLPQAEALKYVREADVCVSPFFPTPILNSTSPTKLVEYMAMSKAVVANDHPEQRLMIEESRAGYCVPYEEQAFADAIVKILRDPQEADAMGLRGYDYVVARRSYRVIADAVEKQLCEIAGKTKH
ncbi:glycosyltransferase family 4 protein [Granulosicoccaceae sp. 1_MG-2023]|nr:glycosyltransferase family 4 protein [Granulosicoccaceae sp. 1_MG-2023]